jgi:exopolysaccharide biosynthesis polyprenyl glycosylphosphotransferase
LMVLTGTFLLTNLDGMPKGMQEFLSVRLTVRNLLVLIAFMALWRLVFRTFGLYGLRPSTWRSEILRTAGACALASLATLTFPLMSSSQAFGYATVLYFWIAATVAVLLMRLLLRMLTVSGSQETLDVIIVGSGPRALRLHEDLCGAEGVGYNVIGFIDSNVQAASREIAGKILGPLEQLEHILMRRAVDEVLIALPIKSQYLEVQSAIEICERGGVRARYLADVFSYTKGRQRTVDEGARFHAMNSDSKHDDPRYLLKRTFDICGALIGIVLLAPVIAIAALLIRATGPGPVLFAQERYGLNKRRFRMYKFRTMITGAEALQQNLESQNEALGPVFKIRNDPRITRVGRVLRKTSIDELPQLYNVLRGEMSLVGPRPLPLRDVHRFAEAALMRRFSVKPGLTCLWQISGRSQLGFNDWISLDLEYIDDWSLTLDLMILLRTVPAVLSGRGAN